MRKVRLVLCYINDGIAYELHGELGGSILCPFLGSGLVSCGPWCPKFYFRQEVVAEPGLVTTDTPLYAGRVVVGMGCGAAPTTMEILPWE